MNVRFPLVLLLAAAGTASAVESPQSTTLAPVHVHASDTAVLNVPSVTVRISRRRLRQQNLADSADVLRYAPNLQVRQRYIGDPNAAISGRSSGTLRSYG